MNEVLIHYAELQNLSNSAIKSLKKIVIKFLRISFNMFFTDKRHIEVPALNSTQN